MTKEDLELLKETAKACRKAGISFFKSDKFEFTLTDKEPPSQKPRGKAAAIKASATSVQDEAVEGEGFDSLTDEEKALYSVGPSLGQ